MVIDLFAESRSQFKNGLVNHAFAAALRALLLVSFSSLVRHVVQAFHFIGVVCFM